MKVSWSQHWTGPQISLCNHTCFMLPGEFGGPYGWDTLMSPHVIVRFVFNLRKFLQRSTVHLTGVFASWSWLRQLYSMTLSNQKCVGNKISIFSGLLPIAFMYGIYLHLPTFGWCSYNLIGDVAKHTIAGWCGLFDWKNSPQKEVDKNCRHQSYQLNIIRYF